MDRCVDDGRTFSKLLVMLPGVDVMHREAVNVEGFLCIVHSDINYYMSADTTRRVLGCMRNLRLKSNKTLLTSLNKGGVWRRIRRRRIIWWGGTCRYHNV